ncbi:MAG: class I SAM-dependent methyltransferase [Myxococcales bacterium]|nr:class I SAM-dependent methyltransferase [Myxococcales bacterium]
MADRPRSKLAAAMAAGREQGRRLTPGRPITDHVPTGGLADAELSLAEVEQAVAGGAPLWRREWAVTVARAAQRAGRTAGDDALVARAVALQDALHEQDEREIGPIRESLRAQGFPADAFRAVLDACPTHERDPLVRRLLRVDRVPERVTDKPAGMVHYVASPLDAVLEICRWVGPDDVFCDVGSGLGLVTMLVALITGAEARGVEYDPAYHAWAEARAAELGIPRLRYVQGDARYADYTGVTVLYFYDTFRGTLLEELFVRLQPLAEAGPLRIISRGHSNPVLEAVPWLKVVSRGVAELLVMEAR